MTHAAQEEHKQGRQRKTEREREYGRVGERGRQRLIAREQ